MAAKHALLGLLRDGPAYPYQLADRLQQRLGPAWKINSGHLSQTIKHMAHGGLIERIDDGAKDEKEPHGNKHRHVYAITELGEDEFDRFLNDTTMLVPLAQEQLLMKITLAGPTVCKRCSSRSTQASATAHHA